MSADKARTKVRRLRARYESLNALVYSSLTHEEYVRWSRPRDAYYLTWKHAEMELDDDEI